MKCKKPNTRIKVGMTNLQMIFKDKTNIIRGMTKNELISLYYQIPLNKVNFMKTEGINAKWTEIATVKKYLRNTLICAIDFKRVSKGTILLNEECGKRRLDRNMNIFFKISDVKTGGEIRDKYDKLALSFKKAGDNTYEIAEECEEQAPLLQQMMEVKNGK